MAADFESELKRWGNSYAVRVPKEVVDEAGLKEGKPVRLMILKRPKRGVFGAFPGLPHPQTVKDELRRAHDR